jgi:hypothetical protein
MSALDGPAGSAGEGVDTATQTSAVTMPHMSRAVGKRDMMHLPLVCFSLGNL